MRVTDKRFGACSHTQDATQEMASSAPLGSAATTCARSAQRGPGRAQRRQRWRHAAHATAVILRPPRLALAGVHCEVRPRRRCMSSCSPRLSGCWGMGATGSEHRCQGQQACCCDRRGDLAQLHNCQHQCAKHGQETTCASLSRLRLPVYEYTTRLVNAMAICWQARVCLIGYRHTSACKLLQYSVSNHGVSNHACEQCSAGCARLVCSVLATVHVREWKDALSAFAAAKQIGLASQIRYGASSHLSWRTCPLTV